MFFLTRQARGEAGDNLGALCRGLKREDIVKGLVMCKPGSVTSHTKFEAQMYVLSKEEGGRHTPFVNGYRPQLFTRTADITCTVGLPEGKVCDARNFFRNLLPVLTDAHPQMVMPGEDARLSISLITDMAIEVCCSSARFLRCRRDSASPCARAAELSALALC